MRQYLDLLRKILEEGTEKHPSRKESGQTKNPTIGLPNIHFSYDLQEGFPLLTTRKLPWKGCVGELRAFLEGKTNEQDFQKYGCKFWKPWAKEDGDLGPIYGAQWNAHNQLQHILDCLKNRPTDRRMVVSAWRPDEHQDMVLPPCHFCWVVTPYNGKLNLSWMQRSSDFPIGVSINIASYALLTHILAKWANMEVGQLDAVFCDAHIYKNQIEGVKEQLKRKPRYLPQLQVYFKDPEDFWSWDCVLHNWDPAPNINFGEVEV